MGKLPRVASRGAARAGTPAGLELQPLGSDPGHSPQSPADGGLAHSEIYKQYGLGGGGGAGGHRGGGGGCWAWLHGDGGWVMACGHIICAVIGAGVLSLPHAMAALGWAAGVLSLVAFFAVTLWCSLMLSEMHEYDGVRHGTYGDAVVNILGPGSAAAVTVCQVLNLVLSAIGYTVAAGESLRMVEARGRACDDDPSGGASSCGTPVWLMSAAFGALQLVLSQVPTLEAAWWSSMVGAAMSFLYATAAFGMGAARADPSRMSLLGRADPPLVKSMSVFNALGAIAFAYSFSAVLLEVQDTLHEPPSATRTMKKAVHASLAVTFAAYIGVGVTGYAALGDDTPGNILTGFSRPAALVTAANACVLVHMFPAYQVFSQPVFHMVETAIARSRANRRRRLRLRDREAREARGARGEEEEPGGRKSAASDGGGGGVGANDSDYSAEPPSLALRVVLRSAYVVATTLVAAAMPFFSDIVGLIGAVVFWPSTVYFPIAMYVKVRSPPRWQRLAMGAVNAVTFVVSVLAAVGSAWQIARDAKSYRMFGGGGSDGDNGG